MKRTNRMLDGLVLLISLQATSCFAQQTGSTAPPPQTTARTWSFEATPAWQDEFDYAGAPNPAKWGYDLGGDGWGNNELQYYTDSLDNA